MEYQQAHTNKKYIHNKRSLVTEPGPGILFLDPSSSLLLSL